MIPLLPIADDAPGALLDLDRLISTRLLIQAASGGGKSRALRYILEQTHGHVQQIVIDPEGEFASLREQHDFILVGATGDVPAEPASAALLCRRLMDLSASAVIDLYALRPEDRRKFVRLFLEQLMALGQEYWRPLLIAIDEAQLFVPERGYSEAESADAVIQLCSQGRKRGYAAILATQRVSKIRKDAGGDLLNKMIGLTSQDVDVKRASDELGLDTRSRAALKRLQPGQFYVTGPAFVTEAGERLTDLLIVRTGDVRTSHPDAGKIGAYTPPPAPAAIAAILAQMQDIPAEAQAEAQTVEQLQRQIAELKARTATPATERIVEKTVDRIVEVPVVGAETIAALRETVGALTAQVDALGDQLRGVTDAIARVSPPAARAAYPEHQPRVSLMRETPPAPKATREAKAAPAKAPATKSGAILPARQKILDTLASFEALGIKSMARENVAVYSGISSKSSAYSAHVSELQKAGLISYPSGGLLGLTVSGRAAARAPKAPATRQQLHQAWLSKLKPAQGRMLAELIAVHPKGLTREGLAQRSGQSITSSAFSANVSELKSLDLVTYPKPGAVCAGALLFPKGLS